MRKILFLVALLAVTAAVARTFLERPDPEPSPAAGPSFLFVAVDTLRADHLSCYGYPRATSPALDRRAASGTIFERAYAPAPWTLPSFASVVTGRYPGVHRASHIVVPGAGGGEILYRGLIADAPTLPRHLSDAGFRSALFSSNAHLTPEFGFGPGFDDFDYVPDRPAADTTDAALRWFEGLGARRFFAFVHYNDPHAPFRPPPQHRFEGSLPGGDPAAWQTLPAELSPHLYDGEIATVDAELERLLASLERNGQLADTWIFFFSDHGEELGDHGSHGHGHTLHEELIHVPLIVIPPAGAAPGTARRVADPVSLVDLFPTVLRLADLDALAADAPGRVLVEAIAARRPVFAEAINLEKKNLERAKEQKAVVRGTDKLIFTPVDDRAVWYDLAADPRERSPQTSLREERVRELLRILASHINQPVDRNYSDDVTLSPATAEDLAAIGYLGGASPGLIEIRDPLHAAGLVADPDAATSLRVAPGDLRSSGFELTGLRGPQELHKPSGRAASTSGPYRRLYPGRYRLQVPLWRQGGSGELGVCRVTSGGGAREFARRTLSAGDLPSGRWTTITVPFEVPADSQIEIPLSFVETPEIRLRELTIEFLGRREED